MFSNGSKNDLTAPGTDVCPVCKQIVTLRRAGAGGGARRDASPGFQNYAQMRPGAQVASPI